MSRAPNAAATMLTFTLDTNCIVAVDKGEPEAQDIEKLAAAHRAGVVSVGIVAISASAPYK